MCEGKKELFHSVTQQMLYLIKKDRSGLETFLSFLTTKVICSDEDDWLKLKRYLTFVKNIIDDVRIIGATSFTNMFAWIDSAHAVHVSMPGHTGGAMSMGYGCINQKLSKKSLMSRV